MTSDEERKRRSMGTPVWPLNPAAYNDKFRKPPYVNDTKEYAYTQGVTSDGPVVLKDGQGMSIDEIVDALNGRITLGPLLRDKMEVAEMVERAYRVARDHAPDEHAVMELADDIQMLLLWAWRLGRKS